ncbi:MAG: Transcriptional regulator, TetR family [Frankiales bacterium]|nr:Transcriptional regulator, TetR family [Frankiales bacterium]
MSPAARLRAPALPPEERRRAIVDVTVPLLLEHGASVTTRQIADAAGIAEGTLFRAFDDKAALLHAAAHAVMDPERTRHLFDGLDPGLPLAFAVREVVEHLLASTRQVMSVLMAVRHAVGVPKQAEHGPPAFLLEAHRAQLEALTGVFDRYRDRLRVPPERAALLVRAIVMGSRQPWGGDAEALTADEVTAVLLDGLEGED